MAVNVYRASLKHGLKRIIIASSVHADDYGSWQGDGYIQASLNGRPTTAYGRHKLLIESLGQLYSQSGLLEVVCVRFGGVNSEAMLPPESAPHERCVFLSHSDCVALIRAIIESDSVPGRFYIINAVSDMPERVHDISNPLGWAPAPRSLSTPSGYRAPE